MNTKPKPAEEWAKELRESNDYWDGLMQGVVIGFLFTIIVIKILDHFLQ